MSMSFLASGSVAPCRFIKQDTSNEGYVLAAGAGDLPFGVSQPGTRLPPIDGFDDGFAATQNTASLTVYTAQDECWLEIGAAVTNGDYLKPSTNGVGITASSADNIYGAIALQAGTASGQLIRVRVTGPIYRSA